MSDIVSSVLKHTFGFLANKIRKEVAERLKDGDVTNEECRRLIVREIDDVKSKLDGLARKDLLSSLCFLQEGINGLYQSLLEFPSDENTAEWNEQATLVEAFSSRNAGPDPSGPINEAVALINAVTSLRIRSEERFKSAIESFKLAREKATEAFCNEALPIEDRIQASQIRITARILEKLEDLDASVSDCLQYLKQVHDIGSIREIFSVLFDGGMKSRFNRTKRLNNASSVQDMNHILFNFARKFTKLSLGIFDWPTILIGKEIYNPMFGEKRDDLVTKLEWSHDVQVASWYPDFTFDNGLNTHCSVVNSKGEIVAKIWGKHTIKIFERSGESHTVCEVTMEEPEVIDLYVAAIDIDIKDNIYVITVFRESEDQSWSFKLFIFDENGNKKLETPLSFHQSLIYPQILMSINKDGRIAILNCEEEILYIGNVCVEMNSYEVEQSFSVKVLNTYSFVQLLFSDLNGTQIIVNGLRTVYIYTENGQLQQKIEITDEYGYITSLAIDHTAKGILVTTYSSQTSANCSLLIFSETGELVDSVRLDSNKWDQYVRLTSHPNGAVVLVGEIEAILIKRKQK